ncbi:MAG: GGDEF domain-containing protein [Ruminococcus sp.]|nr:GGDEF domain-containing protein [Ruminococcus sp.]
MKRPCIGIVARSIDEAYPREIIEGAATQAFKMDYDVAVFCVFDENTYNKDYHEGEMNIFSLINADKFDGFLYPAAMFNDSDMRQQISDILKSTGKPVVTIDNDETDYTAVLRDERQPFKEVVNHLIDVHGLTDIMCLTGRKDTFQAEERLEAYKETLREHNIEVREDHCIYGDYWSDVAWDLAEKMDRGEMAVPQALVCANDRMAMFFIERFTELGHKVPEEIAVVGYDGITESRDNVPTICTYKGPDAQLGADGFSKLYELMTGKKCETINLHSGFVIRGESCGCLEDNSTKVRIMRQNTRIEQNRREYFRTANVFENLSRTDTFNDFITYLGQTIYTFAAGKKECKYDLCLCKDWDSMASDENYITKGYGKVVQSVCKDLEERFDFDPNEIYPLMWEEKDYSSIYYFFPVHFNDRCLGYSVVWYDGHVDVCGRTFWDWHKAVTNAIEFRRVRICLESLNRITYLNSIKDKLTGIYNRSGFEKYADEFMQAAKETGKKLMLISCDMDGLKYVNDTFGHLEGDVSLRIIANGLSYVCLSNEICARVGGDEFMVIGYGDYNDTVVKETISQFEKYLDRYNLANNNKYKVAASTGYVVCDIDKNTTLNQLERIADELMYVNKFSKPDRHKRTETE